MKEDKPMGPFQRAQPLIIILLLALLTAQTAFQRVIVSTQTCIFETNDGHPVDMTASSWSNQKNSVVRSSDGVGGKGSSKELGRITTSPEKAEYDGPSITWEAWPEDRPFPCSPGEHTWKTIKTQRSPANTGLMFVREMKTGSSTVSGILLRIAHLKGEKLLSKGSRCRMRVDHSSARSMRYAFRNKKKSFLMSLLRDPTKRAISHFFHFQVSQSKVDPTDEIFQHFFVKNERRWSNYYTKDLSMRDIDLKEEFPEKLVQDILKQYNFIAITERMDESLVVFKILLGLDFEDILYMSAKSSGSFTTGPEERPCIYLTPAFISAGMKEFFASEYWQEYTRVDNLLYQAAVQSLDNTIDALGREKVEAELATFRKVKTYTHDKCNDRTVYRCNAKGEQIGQNSTCYMWDIGCGYDCMNEVSVERDVLNA